MIDLNRRVLIETAFEGDRPFGVQNLPGLRRAVSIPQHLFLRDPHKRATLLCCALIANHPFNDGNHRTSLEAATLQLMLDGWFYTGTEEHEKVIYNWRFDYEELHGLESAWSVNFGGWDDAGQELHIVRLVESEYGAEIEKFLRDHTEKGPLESILVALPPSVYSFYMRAYPSGPWKKELNRFRRSRASELRKTAWADMEKLLSRKPKTSPTPKKHWRPEKL